MNKERGDLAVIDTKTHQDMLEQQQQFQLDNQELADVENEKRREHHIAHANYISFLRQMAKLRWVQEGDDNTHFFHQSIKIRRCQTELMLCKIDMVLGSIQRLM